MNDQKINRLKDLQSVSPLVIDEPEIEVLGFSIVENKVTINLKLSDAPTYGNAIVSIGDLYSFKEDISMYVRDQFYYRYEIQDLLESYIAERAGDYKIEKEA